MARVFGGSTQTSVTCLTCGGKSAHVEGFHCLSVDIAYDPPGTPGAAPTAPSTGSAASAAAAAAAANGGPIQRGRMASTPPTSLFACLRALTRGETMAGGEAYACATCKTKQTASKRLFLHLLPRGALVIHLNRAMWRATGPRGAAVREKTHAFVAFPTALTPQDLDPFLSDEARAAQRRAAAERAGPASVAAAAAAAAAAAGATGGAAAWSPSPGPAAYRLAAIVEHRGRGIDAGHYVAYIYDAEAECWLLYDDASVRVVSEEEVMRLQAYLLIYERV
jgi:hypothetical protein